MRYGPQGHYSCHHDSSPDAIDEGNIRMATIAIFLNDVESGGELCFPGKLADGSERWGEQEWQNIETQCQNTSQCAKLNSLVIPPKKGDAAFWYNIKPKLAQKRAAGKKVRGDDLLYWSSVHCGAEVHAGEKWLANVWVHLPGQKRSEL